MPVRYKKLRGGSWGFAITGKEANGIEVGDLLEVLVRQRTGIEELRSISAFWKGRNLYEEGDVVLAAFAKADATSPRKHPSGTAAGERRTVEGEMRSMRIATSSVRSIRKRLPSVLRWLAERKPDIVALQKISAPEAAFPTRALQEIGYHSAAFGPTCRTDYGVAVLSRRELPKPEVRFRGLPCPEANGARLLTVDIGKIRFSSVYAPFGNPRKYGNKQAIERRVAWLRCLRTHVREAGYAGRQVLLCGDFNVLPDGPPRRGGAYSEREQHELARLCKLGFVDLYRRAHPGEKAGFNFGFKFSEEGTSRLHLILGSKSLADCIREAWVDMDYRTEAAPVVVDLDGVTI